MKFKIDENLPIEIAQILREAGYDAMTVLEQRLGGEKDSTLIKICQMEERIIVTLDLDFADIRTYPPQDFAGLIVLRLAQQDKPYVLAITRQLIKALGEHAIQNKLWIVDEKRIRIRA